MVHFVLIMIDINWDTDWDASMNHVRNRSVPIGLLHLRDLFLELALGLPDLSLQLLVDSLRFAEAAAANNDRDEQKAKDHDVDDHSDK